MISIIKKISLEVIWFFAIINLTFLVTSHNSIFEINCGELIIYLRNSICMDKNIEILELKFHFRKSIIVLFTFSGSGEKRSCPISSNKTNFALDILLAKISAF